MKLVLPLSLPPPEDDASMLWIVAFDPGGVTGWCVLRVGMKDLLSNGFRSVALSGRMAWEGGEFAGSEIHQVDEMMGLVRSVWLEGEWTSGSESDALALVIEDFILRKFSMDRNLLSPVRITAAFNYAARSVPVPLLLQTSSEALKTITDARLKDLNMWTAGSTHTRDATRHAVLMARKFVQLHWRNAILRGCPWLISR